MSLRGSINKLFGSATSVKSDTPPQENEHPALDTVETIKVRVGLEKDLFSHTGNAIPIIAVGSGTPFHNLQIRGEVVAGNDLVLEDSTNGQVVAVMERHYATAGKDFKIFSTVPAYSDEIRANLLKYDQDMYAYAEVKQSDKVWNVVMEGDTTPMYEIHKVVPVAGRHFPTTHIIKKHGEEVASTRYGHAGNSFILTVDEGVDPSLMICLAIIADDADK